MNNKHIIIFSDNDGMHEGKLGSAFTAHGVNVSRVSLMDCQLNYRPGASGLLIPGFDLCLPDAAFVRSIAAGSFEQVTFRLDILHALEACGVLVYNSARAIECTVDKGMTSFLLAHAGVPSPTTWVCEAEDEAREIVRRETGMNHKLVLKPLFGNCGRGLLLLEHASSLPAISDVNGVYYLQHYIRDADGKNRDWRVLVVANQAIAAMERISDHWITNRARGGHCLPAVLTREVRDLAEAASRAVGTNYAGVDIIRDTEGNYLVLEVNSVPAWRGLQAVTDIDIAELLTGDLMSLCTGLETQSPIRSRLT